MKLEPGLDLGNGKYQLVHCLGSGSQAEVWEARQSGLAGFSKSVVLKCMDVGAVGPSHQQLMLREARLAASLHHPNITEIYDVGQDGDLLYIAMERIRGLDLEAVLRKHQHKGSGSLPWELVTAIGIEVSKALHHAHEQATHENTPLHIVHRDLKPSNILLSQEGYIKVIDFGIAKATHPEKREGTHAGRVKGTPAYMSPEQIMEQNVDARSDLFSLGTILYELFTGQRPFPGEDLFSMLALVVNEPHKPLQERRADVPPELGAIVDKLLQKQPEKRFQNARAIRRALESTLRSKQIFVEQEELMAFFQSLDEEPASDEDDPQKTPIQQEAPIFSEQIQRFVLDADQGTPTPRTSPGLNQSPLSTNTDGLSFEVVQLDFGQEELTSAEEPSESWLARSAPTPPRLQNQEASETSSPKGSLIDSLSITPSKSLTDELSGDLDSLFDSLQISPKEGASPLTLEWGDEAEAETETSQANAQTPFGSPKASDKAEAERGLASIAQGKQEPLSTANISPFDVPTFRSPSTLAQLENTTLKLTEKQPAYQGPQTKPASTKTQTKTPTPTTQKAPPPTKLGEGRTEEEPTDSHTSDHTHKLEESGDSSWPTSQRSPLADVAPPMLLPIEDLSSHPPETLSEESQPATSLDQVYDQASMLDEALGFDEGDQTVATSRSPFADAHDSGEDSMLSATQAQDLSPFASHALPHLALGDSREEIPSINRGEIYETKKSLVLPESVREALSQNQKQAETEPEPPTASPKPSASVKAAASIPAQSPPPTIPTRTSDIRTAIASPQPRTQEQRKAPFGQSSQSRTRAQAQSAALPPRLPIIRPEPETPPPEKGNRGVLIASFIVILALIGVLVYLLFLR